LFYTPSRLGADESKVAECRHQSPCGGKVILPRRIDAGVASKAAYERLASETAYYNDKLADGKWKNMMSANPHNQDVFRMPKLVEIPKPDGPKRSRHESIFNQS